MAERCTDLRHCWNLNTEMFEFSLVRERKISMSSYIQTSILALLIPAALAQRWNEMKRHFIFGPFTQNGVVE